MKQVITFDLETSFIPDLTCNVEEIFCIGLKVNDEPTLCFTSEPKPYSDGSLKEAYKLLNNADLLVGHNICKFDIPMIEKFLGKLKPKICDTLIDAKLCYSKDNIIAIDKSLKDFPSSLVGSYSLKAFGIRFGLAKLDYDDFSHLCEDMVVYCKRDVDLTYEMYKHFSSLSHYPNELVRDCEYRVARILYDQEMFGFYFDIDKAMDVSAKLQWKALNTERRLRSTFSPVFIPDGDIVIPKKKRKVKLFKPIKLNPLAPFDIENNGLNIHKNGQWKFPPRSMKYKDFPHRIVYEHYIERTPYQKIKLQKFNPNSRQQIVQRLQSTFNINIESYTPKGNFKLNEDVLDLMIKELENE